METIDHRGFLVVERGHGLKHWSEATPARGGSWRPAIDLDYATILRRYRGFEGLPWPESAALDEIGLQQGLASESQFAAVRDYALALARTDATLDLIAIGPAGDSSTAWLPDGFAFCGYDYGHGVDDDYRCSLLYHEVIFGLETPLREFGKSLNERLLLRRFEDVLELDRTRATLLARGAAIEDTGYDDPTGVVAVFARPNDP